MKALHTFICLLLLATALPQRGVHAQSRRLLWGYCNDTILTCTGLNSEAKGAGAIYIPAEQAAVFAGSRLTHLRLGFHQQTGDLEIFITDDLNGTPAYTQAVGTLPKGWSEVTLDEPFPLDGKAFYVGFTATAYNPLAMSDNFHPDAHWANLYDRWQDNALVWGDKALCIRLVLEGGHFPADLVLESLERAYGEPGGTAQVRGVVRNRCDAAISGYELDYRIGDGEKATVRIDRTLAPMQTDTFRVDVPAPRQLGSFPLTVSVVPEDGAADALPANNTLTSTLTCLEYAFIRKVVVEEGTGTWCGWCPRGTVGLRRMSERYPDTFIGIAMHSAAGRYDPMEAPSYLPVIGKYISGYPGCIINRLDPYKTSPTHSTLQSAYNELAVPVDAKIEASARFTTAERKSITVETETRFAFTSADTLFRIAYVLLENGVTGYTQSNNYAGGKNGCMGGFEDLSFYPYVPFDHVARGIYGNAWGTEGSVPAAIEKGKTYRYAYEIPVPETIQDADKLEVAVLLLSVATGEIVNADKTAVVPDMSTGIALPGTAQPHVTVTGRSIRVPGHEGRFRVYATDGRPVAPDHLASGIYLVRTTDAQGRTSVRKVLVGRP